MLLVNKKSSEIIVAILDNDGPCYADLKDIIDSPYYWIHNQVEEMRKEGLVDIEEVEYKVRGDHTLEKKSIRLTEDGEKVAKSTKKIRGLVS